MKKVTVTYGRTVSKNYQSQRAEAAYDFDVKDSDDLSEVMEDGLVYLKEMINKFLGVQE